MSHSHYLELATCWDKEGRPEGLLPQDFWLVVGMRLWAQSDAARYWPVDPLVVQYRSACEYVVGQRYTDWFARAMAKRLNCDYCYETMKMENLYICTRCNAIVCSGCMRWGQAFTGNPSHACGGELVG